MKLINSSSKTGSIGNLVYARYRQGTSVRARVTSRNPQTRSQQANRAGFAAATIGWRGLTARQRALWERYAAQMHGHLAGFNAYMQVNKVRHTCGDALFESPPPLPDFGVLKLTAFKAVHDFAAPHAFRMALRAKNTIAPDRYIVEATPAVSPGISNHGTTYRVIMTPADIADLGAMETAYLARFVNPLNGKAIAVRITPVMNGRKGVAFGIATVVRQLAA
jgi:hypothetical protein